jgi:hypothetical protein
LNTVILSKVRRETVTTRIEALNYRSLRYVAQEVKRFQILVGPNASGKSTFLDVVSFMGDLLRAGLPGAVEGDARLGVAERAPDARQLVWMKRGKSFELAVELEIPEDRRKKLPNGSFSRVRYELSIAAKDELAIGGEAVWLIPGRAVTAELREPTHTSF